MNNAIEVVIFKAKPGVDEARMKSAASAIKPRIQQLPGFISREFGVSEDGTYVDIVHWQDLASARAGAQAVNDIPECGAFFSLIDEGSAQMLHFESVVS